MATYKVIQDIEAEDKLLGPLSLRQFIYAIIVVISLFIAYRLVSVQWFLALPLLPPIIFFGLLAAPLGREQSSEVWLLAKIRFALKPRKRIWDQSGTKRLVTITAPKKIEKVLVKELSQTEVHSRLEALANTIDSRGWAVKNVNVNLFAQPSYAAAGTDRLLDAGAMPQQVPAYDVTANDDILDEKNNPTAQNLDRMINASSKAHRDQLVAQMKQTGQQADQPAQGVGPQNGTQPAADYWFLNANGGAPAPPPGMSTFQSNNVVPPNLPSQPPASGPQPTPSLSEQELLNKIHAEKEKPKSYGHMRVIKPIEEQEAEARAKAAEAAKQPPPPVTPPPDPAILELANNDDLNVATIARQAHKKGRGKEPPNDEVVISLH